MENFEKFNLDNKILKALAEARFTNPTEIQEKSIPLVLDGKDLIAESATGSGKTLAFGAGVIQNAERGKGIQALILTPTRELAEQVAQSLKKFSRYYNLNIIAIYGGVSIDPQIKSLKDSEIIVGTPGRIIDHLNRRTINLENLKVLVLDEADRMIDMGFIEDVEKIITECPIKRQTMLFSATISGDINYISKKYMKNPIIISVNNRVDPTKLKQIYYDVPSNLKFSLLVNLLKKEKSRLVMVFCNTQRNTDFVAKNLKFSGIDSQAIHGGFSQDKRKKTIERFHSNKVQVLVCTDIAARGLDINNVSHVYNYDIPKESNQYIHRIGRTARAGKEGIAVNIVTDRDYESFSNILNKLSIQIKNERTPQISKVRIRWMENKKNSFNSRNQKTSRNSRNQESYKNQRNPKKFNKNNKYRKRR